MVRRSAFTFIELIFAIVIIAITVLSLPVMNQALSKGNDAALVQEAIFAATTELNQATTYRWDENSLEAKTAYSRVVPTSNTDCNTNHLRPGHIPNQTLHRRCTNNDALRPSTIGIDTNDNDIADDLDDTNGTTSNMYSDDASTASGYKKDLNIRTDVNYVAFGDITKDEKNMKKISVTVSNADGTVALLSTYSANIGEVGYYHKRYY